MQTKCETSLVKDGKVVIETFGAYFARKMTGGAVLGTRKTSFRSIISSTGAYG